MKRFTRGAAGVGLLILRLAITFNIIAVMLPLSVNTLREVVAFTVTVLCLSLVVGIFTVFSSCLAGVGAVVSGALLQGALLIPFGSLCLLCIALALAGPGAYSMDALLWGPRRVTFPGK